MLHARHLAITNNEMILDYQSKVGGLFDQKARVFDVSLARARTAGGMVVRQQYPPGVEVERASEEFARGDKDISLCSLGDDLFADHLPGSICKDREHAFFGEILHR